MKILLAPSELKSTTSQGISLSSLTKYQLEILEHYENFIAKSSIEELSVWFGIKNLNEVEKYSKSLKNKPTIKAIQRYTGVAFEALEYEHLSVKEQNYCDDNILIFSNLFGVLKASDLIPDYKYKQGAKLPTIDVEKFYKKNLKMELDDLLGDEVVDLRAKYYDKFYKPTAPTITFKFLKNGKVVSHWAKYYRGLVVRTMAKNNIQSFVQLINMPIDTLKLLEIQEKKNIKILIMDIKF